MCEVLRSDRFPSYGLWSRLTGRAVRFAEDDKGASQPPGGKGTKVGGDGVGVHHAIAQDEGEDDRLASPPSCLCYLAADNLVARPGTAR